MKTGGKVPPALQSKVENYWSRYHDAHPGIDITAFESQMASFIKGLPQASDGRYIAHVDTVINLSYPELRADPRIKWVNDKGEEVVPPGVDKTLYTAAAEPEAPPAPGAEALQAGAKKYSPDLAAELFGPPKHVDLGMSGELWNQVFSSLQDEQDAGNIGLRKLGGSEMQFKVNDIPYEPLARMGDVKSGKALAEKLTKKFEGKIDGDFGVVRKGKEIYLMSPANMKDLRAVADDKGNLPGGMKIE